MHRRINRKYLAKLILTALLLPLISCISFAQNIDSAKVKKQPVSIVDSGLNKFYAQLPAIRHTKRIAKPILQDSDGDGVPDQLDHEPNTPRGAEVDSHGRAIDTDGGGVPDYREKEKLTPKSCFPVNSDGVGVCPEPACCRDARDKINEHVNDETDDPYRCRLNSLPSIRFEENSANLERGAKRLLDSAFSQCGSSSCLIKIFASKYQSANKQKLESDRVMQLTKFLMEKYGLSNEAIVCVYDDVVVHPNVL